MKRKTTLTIEVGDVEVALTGELGSIEISVGGEMSQRHLFKFNNTASFQQFKAALTELGRDAWPPTNGVEKGV